MRLSSVGSRFGLITTLALPRSAPAFTACSDDGDGTSGNHDGSGISGQHRVRASRQAASR